MLRRTQCPAVRGAVPAGHGGGVRGEGVGAGEALVGVQVEADVAAPGDRDEAVEVGDRVVGEVRRSTDEVDARVEGGVEHGIGHGRPAQGHELEVHEAAELFAQPHQGTDADEGVGSVQQVDVGAHGGDPGCQHPQRRGAGPVERLVLVERLGEGLPALDGADEVAERGLDGIPRLGFVEVPVGLGAGGRDDVAARSRISPRSRAAASPPEPPRRPSRRRSRCPRARRTPAARCGSR